MPRDWDGTPEGFPLGYAVEDPQRAGTRPLREGAVAWDLRDRRALPHPLADGMPVPGLRHIVGRVVDGTLVE